MWWVRKLPIHTHFNELVQWIRLSWIEQVYSVASNYRLPPVTICSFTKSIILIRGCSQGESALSTIQAHWMDESRNHTSFLDQWVQQAKKDAENDQTWQVLAILKLYNVNLRQSFEPGVIIKFVSRNWTSIHEWCSQCVAELTDNRLLKLNSTSVPVYCGDSAVTSHRQYNSRQLQQVYL